MSSQPVKLTTFIYIYFSNNLGHVNNDLFCKTISQLQSNQLHEIVWKHL